MRTPSPPSDTPAPDLLPRLRSLTTGLVPSERRVADIILTDPRRAARLTISQLAQAAETSQTTVLRLCRELGVRGYRDLRVTLAAESGRAAGRAEGDADDGAAVGSDIGRTDSLDEVIRTITHADSQAVLETGTLIDRAVLEDAVTAVAGARRIDIFGVGASAFVAQDLQQKLLRIDLISFSWLDQHAALTATALRRPSDVTIGISHTGETRDTVDVMQRAKAQGATTVAITAAPRSHLARAADLTLVTASRETTFRAGATASRIAALTTVDILFVAVAQRRYEQTLAAVDATRRAVAHRRFAPRGMSGRS
jgi:DNA-binding MurR/RpiR family transcriptional regulator